LCAVQEQFAVFISGVCDDFGMSPGSSITQDQFMAALKAQLRAAAGTTSSSSSSAAAATGMPARATGTPKAAAAAAAAADGKAAGAAKQQQQQQHVAAAAAGDDALPTAAGQQPEQQAASQLTRTSAFAPYSSYDGLDDDTAAAPEASPFAAMLPALHASAAECRQQSAETGVPSDSTTCKLAAAAIFRAAAEDPKVSEAADTLATASSAEMDAAAAECAANETAGGSTCPNLNVPACSPGMLTCAAARLQRNALLRQTITKQKQPQQPAAAAAGRSAALPPAAADAPDISSRETIQQVAKYRQALSRFRAASKVVLAANASAASGMQQLKEARQMRTASQVCSQMASAGPCATLDEARALCLNQLADFLMMQHLQVSGLGHMIGNFFSNVTFVKSCVMRLARCASTSWLTS
jgi:hypothetical protein